MAVDLSGVKLYQLFLEICIGALAISGIYINDLTEPAISAFELNHDLN